MPVLRRNGSAEWSPRSSSDPLPLQRASLVLSDRYRSPAGVVIALSTLLGGVGGYVGGRGGTAFVLSAIVVATVPLLLLAARWCWRLAGGSQLIELRVMSIPWIRTVTEDAALVTAVLSAAVIWFAAGRGLDDRIWAGLFAVLCFSVALALHVAGVNVRVRACYAVLT